MKLGDLGTFKTGGTPSRSKNEYWGDKYPWISSTALGDVYIDENAATDWISDEGLKNSSTKLIKANSLMIGIRIGVGKCSINRIPMCTSQDVVSIEGIDTERYYLPYITTLINNKRHYLESLKRGATIQGITTDIIKNLQIPDIQINRQKLIADTIQVVDDMVCLSHKQLAKLDTLVKSRFIEMFGDPVTNPMGWEELSWQDVFETTTGKLDSNAAVEGGRYPFFTCAKEPLAIDTYAFDYEALLLAGNNAAGVYDVKYYNGKFNAYQRTYVLQLKTSEWRYEIFKYQLAGHLKYLQRQSIGTNTKYLTLGILHRLRFVAPPIALQNQFAAFVEQVDKSKLVLQKLLEKQETLRAALMQEYFG